MDKLIITVAGVGAETTKEAQPALPISAQEIGEDAARCREAGASIYHLHVRRPDGTPTQDRDVFAAAIAAIRERTDIIIQVSTGGAMGMTADERLQPLELEPRDGVADDRDGQLRRRGVLQRRRPDEASSTRACRRRACGPSSRSSKPARSTTRCGWSSSTVLPARCIHWDFVLGVPGSMSGEPRNLTFLVDRIPEGSTWTATGIGRWHMPVTMTALALGGNVRLGLEDNIYYHKGVLTDGNAQLTAAWRASPRSGGASAPPPTRRARSCSWAWRRPAPEVVT